MTQSPTQRLLESLGRMRAVAAQHLINGDPGAAAAILRETADILDSVVTQSTDEPAGVLLQSLPSPAGWLRQGQRQLVQAVDYDKSSGNLKISGTATTADLPNSKGEVYPKTVWMKAWPAMLKAVREGRLLGQLDHPDGVTGSLDRIAAKYDRLFWEGSKLKFEATVFPTAEGLKLQSLIRAGVNIDVSTRGTGETKVQEWEGKKRKVVQPGFKLFGLDFVVSGASPDSRIESWQNAA